MHLLFTVAKNNMVFAVFCYFNWQKVSEKAENSNKIELSFYI